MYITGGRSWLLIVYPSLDQLRSGRRLRACNAAPFFPIWVVPNSSSFCLSRICLRRPRKIRPTPFAPPGHGSSPHMSGELFKYIAQVDLTHAPYRRAAPAFTDVIAGRVHCTFAVMPSGSTALAQSGQLRALGVTTATVRPDVLGEVPTLPRLVFQATTHVLVRIFRAG